MNVTLNSGLSRLLPAITGMGLLSGTVTIQVFDGTLGDSGVERRDVDANWDDLAGHVDLACMVAADIFMTRITQSTERRSADVISEQDLQHCLLDGYYPEIQKTHRAVVTRGAVTRTFDISGIEHDSQVNMTRLALRRVDL